VCLTIGDRRPLQLPQKEKLLRSFSRRVLARNGLSQGALAADAGIYQELISRIENGAANPELDTLGKIAAALGVHPRELLDE
jgi:transcriptional regulator with XRE-family HTH domain